MMIFQTAGTAGLGFAGGVLDHCGPPATTFRNNSYIHRLNRSLQAEMRSLSAYASVIERSTASGVGTPAPLLLEHLEHHQAAARALVRLIIAHRGVPEDRSALSFGLTRRLVNFCASMPTRLFERATLGTLWTLEKQLVTSYKRLLDEAPLQDLPILQELIARAQRHLKNFETSEQLPTQLAPQLKSQQE